jgi:hypothetical protein
VVNTQPSNPGFSRHFETCDPLLETKVGVLSKTAFDLLATNPRILPLVWLKALQSAREKECGEAVLPPGGARLVTIHCQHLGIPFQTRHRFDSRGRFDTSRCFGCIAKHP